VIVVVRGKWNDAGEAGETEVWLEFAKDFEYLSEDRYFYFADGYDEINRMLFKMIEKQDKFCIQKAPVE
jgi:four helix bundle protein